MTRPHPHVAAAQGLTRAGLDWLDGYGDLPFRVIESVGDEPTPTFGATINATGVVPAQACAAFDTAQSVAVVRNARAVWP